MSTLTTNFSFVKPDVAELFNIATFNTNFDLADAAIASRLASNGNGSSLTIGFVQAGARANLVSGESLAVTMGKLMKWYADLHAVAFSGDYTALSNKPTTLASFTADSTHRVVTDVQISAWDSKLAATLKGAVNGLAELDSSGRVPSAQLPAYVDDVVEYATFSVLPATGEVSKIYVIVNTNLTYRWSGSAYVEISASLALGETSSTAYRGDRGKIAYDYTNSISSFLTNLGVGSGITVAFAQAGARANLVSGESLATVFGKLMKWYSDLHAVAFSGDYNALSNKPTTLAASGVTAGTLGGQVVANATAVETTTTAQVRNLRADTVDLTAGVSSLNTGELYAVYE